jgi:hypothetical protein
MVGNGRAARKSALERTLNSTLGRTMTIFVFILTLTLKWDMLGSETTWNHRNHLFWGCCWVG